MEDDVDRWRKSTRCGQSFSCVEVGQGPAVIGVRDTELEHSPVLAFGRREWAAFVRQVKTLDTLTVSTP